MLSLSTPVTRVCILSSKSTWSSPVSLLVLVFSRLSKATHTSLMKDAAKAESKCCRTEKAMSRLLSLRRTLDGSCLC